jgi:hypothetical protein
MSGGGFFGFRLERDRRFSPGLSSIDPAGYPGHRRNEHSVPIRPFFGGGTQSSIQRIRLENDFEIVDEDLQALVRIN